MNAGLALARRLTEFNNNDNNTSFAVAQEIGLAQRVARDVVVALNLALIHQPVAEAVFLGNNRSTQEQEAYAMDLCKRLAAMFRDGFAEQDVDRANTVQANVFELAAKLDYWYRTLLHAGALATANHRAGLFRKNLRLDGHQTTMYLALAVPLAEGSVEKGRNLNMQEVKVRSEAAMMALQNNGN